MSSLLLNWVTRSLCVKCAPLATRSARCGVSFTSTCKAADRAGPPTAQPALLGGQSSLAAAAPPRTASQSPSCPSNPVHPPCPTAFPPCPRPHPRTRHHRTPFSPVRLHRVVGRCVTRGPAGKDWLICYPASAAFLHRRDHDDVLVPGYQHRTRG